MAIPEAKEESVPSTDIPEAPKEGNDNIPVPCDVKPPPPPAIGKTTRTKTNAAKPVVKEERKRAQTESVDIFKQIQSGTFLRKVSPAEKTSYMQRAQTEMFKGFNMAKIVARRTALEFSDDEDEEDWSDHDDEEDWW